MDLISREAEIEERKEESAQNVPKEDLISRKAAIDAVNGVIADYIPTLYGRYEALPLEMAMAIKRLPTAQPEKRTAERTETHACDSISRRAAIDALDKEYRCTDQSDDWDGLKTAMLIIENLPSAQPERKKGKWSFIGDNMFECTCCGTPYTTQQLNGLRNYNTDPYAPKFCPNCGADMRGDTDEVD